MLSSLNILYLLVGVLTGVAAQILLKASAPVLKDAGPWELITSKHFIAALSLQWFSAFMWVYLMRSLDLSRAYPFTALSFLIIPIFGYFLFGETIDKRYLLGLALICAGVLLAKP